MSKPVVLTIAGSDPSGGAGLQADLKTFAAHGVYGVSAVTALTAQNEHRFDLMPVRASFIAAQIDAVFEEFRVKAIKIGMLANKQAVQAVIDCLRRHNSEGAIPVIVDPVIRASNGGLALDQEGSELLRAQLLPLTTLIKPNIMEAALLLGDKPAINLEQMNGHAVRLGTFGCEYVLMTGGHLTGPEVVDVLCHAGECTIHRTKKLETGDVHGTGCTLTSSIAAHLANGQGVIQSVERAQAYLLRLLRGKYQFSESGAARSLDHLSFDENKSD